MAKDLKQATSGQDKLGEKNGSLLQEVEALTEKKTSLEMQLTEVKELLRKSEQKIGGLKSRMVTMIPLLR